MQARWAEGKNARNTELCFTCTVGKLAGATMRFIAKDIERADVVKVPVCQENILQSSTVLGNLLQNHVSVCRRVNDCGLIAADEQIAVRAEGTGKKIVNFHSFSPSQNQLYLIL